MTTTTRCATLSLTLAGLCAAVTPATAAPADATATASAPAAPREPAAPTLNWAGVGLRFGTALWSFESDGVRELVRGDQAGSPARELVAGRVQDLDDTLRVVTPTLHFGGDDFFVKLEGHLGSSETYKSYGLGIYPLNYGRFVPALGLFPYLSAGGVGSYVVGRDGAPSAGLDAKGFIVQGRAALGVKFRPIDFLSLSVELGYSPWAAGLIKATDPSSTLGASARQAGIDIPGADTTAKGGTGQVVDFSLGIELL